MSYQLTHIQTALSQTFPLVVAKIRADTRHKRVIVFEHLFIPKLHRGKGMARSYIEMLTDFADKENLVITMSPSNVFGSNLSRLETFYGSLGFEKNSKRLKEFRSLEKMIREIR